MALTMVIVAGDIDLSFPSVMALGMVGFVWTWEATDSVELGVVAALAVGRRGGSLQRRWSSRSSASHRSSSRSAPSSCSVGSPWCSWRGKSYALVETQEAARYGFLVGKLLGIPMEFCWLVLVDGRRVAAAQPAPARAERVRHRRQPPGRRAHGHPHPADPDPAVRARRASRPRSPALLNSLQVVNFYPTMGQRIPAAHAGRGLRRRHIGVRRPRQHLGHVHRRVHDRRHHTRASSPPA